MNNMNPPVRENETKVWNLSFTSIFITTMLMFMGQQMMNTLVAKYANSLGATPMVVGFVTSSFAYTALLFKIFAAPAIDTFNKRYILMFSILVIALAYFGFSMSESVPLLFICRLLQGAGQAFSATCALALATDTLPQDKLGAGISVYSLSQVICQSIGPSIGLWLSREIGYQYTFLIGSGTMVIAACFAFRIKNNYTPNHKTYSIRLENIITKEAILPAALMFLLSMSYYNITTYFFLYSETVHAEEHIGLFFTVYALTLLVTRPIIGRTGDRYGLIRIFLPAFAAFATAFLLISWGTNIVMFLIAAFISAFGYGACQPAVQTLCMKLVPQEKRGAGSSTNYIGQDLGNLLGPIIAGFFVQRDGYPVMWRIMIIPVAISAILVIRNKDKIQNAGKKAIG